LFDKAKTLGKLKELVEKRDDTYATVPWIAWICAGPGNDKKWGKPKDLAALMAKLIAGGAQLALIDEEDRHSRHALAQILRFDELTIDQRIALVEQAIECGANPAARIVYPTFAVEDGPCIGYHVTSSALDIAVEEVDDNPQILDMIEPHVERGTLEDAFLRQAIDLVHRNRKVEEVAKLLERAGDDLDRVVTRLDSTDRGALVHFLCGSEVSFELFASVIDKVDVDLPLPAPLTVQVSVSWGIVPSIKAPAGATPLDIVEMVHGFVARAEATNAKKPDSSFRADNATKMKAIAEQKTAKLVELGAKHGEKSDALDLPPILAETAAQVLRLAKLVGADDAPIRETIASMNLDGTGPWGFLHELVPTFESELVTEQVAGPLRTLLAAFTSDRWSNQAKKTRIPSSRRSAVELAIEFDDDLFAVKTDGGTQIWRVEDDEVTVLGESVPAYLARVIDAWQSDEN
jgi:hypothetical protein